ncbi:DUF1194 domain-containing protein [Roseibacillus persicicus]|uniref:Ice-binding protein C-terminal domain-containing protein n=1 Tax=Roseibacillus persicicus TaxID=454148 RepID=A0A918WPV6_9BACT|nr:DUF1194 domain-containing protein [Roseibacillus persicicus]GHC64846.1 hypothetical protein GCM10007100_35680 [Roseibacillus persicicus]
MKTKLSAGCSASKTLASAFSVLALSVTAMAAPVDSEILILVDGQTFSQNSFDLMMEGVAQAFEQQGFIDSVASGPYGKIASSVLIFNANGTSTAIPWMEMSSSSDLQTFANAVRNVSAPFSFGGISYVDAISSGAASIASSTFEGTLSQMTVIEDGGFFLFSDGPSEVQAARDTALSSGVDVINSVVYNAAGRQAAIESYYESNVVSGGVNGEVAVVGSIPFVNPSPAVSAAIQSSIANSVTNPTIAAAQAVPEPSSMLLVSLSGLAMLSRRRR